MERDIWKLIVAATKALPRRWRPNSVYSNRQILDVYWWAVINNKPVSWACRRENWPRQAWRRSLPDQSTMSRRLCDPQILQDINWVLHRLQNKWPPGRVCYIDGKAFPLRMHSTDPEATRGKISGGFAKGYKLHAITDDEHRVVSWDVRPLNEGESSIARELITKMPLCGRIRSLIGDAAYGGNLTIARAARRGLWLWAPRQKPGTGLGHRKHHPNRLIGIKLLEQRPGWMGPFIMNLRRDIERFFAGLGAASIGLSHLPSWVRRLHRVRPWIAAKLVLNAARLCLKRANLA